MGMTWTATCATSCGDDRTEGRRHGSRRRPRRRWSRLPATSPPGCSRCRKRSAASMAPTCRATAAPPAARRRTSCHRPRRGRHAGPHPRRAAVSSSPTPPRPCAPRLRRARALPDAGRWPLLHLRAPAPCLPHLRLPGAPRGRGRHRWRPGQGRHRARARRWRFSYPTRPTGPARGRPHGRGVPPPTRRRPTQGAVPAGATALAVLAIELHDTFLDADSDRGRTRVVVPAPSVVRVELNRRRRPASDNAGRHPHDVWCSREPPRAHSPR